MRGLVSFGNEIGILAEAILCSSDPDSLDGVILADGDKRVAVIDGTAPHATDPKYPGAVDEIVNLGEGFDRVYLSARRDEIIALDRAKAEAYRSAYSALRRAGDVYRNIVGLFQNTPLYSLAESISEDLVQTLSEGASYTNYDRRLYSAFGKKGLFHLPSKGVKNTITIGGEMPLVDAIMRLCSESLTAAKKVWRISPSPLDDVITERIYTSGQVLKSVFTDGCDIDLYEYRLDREVASLCKEYDSLLLSAREHFDTASRAHFEIEGIYRHGVDFLNNERIFDRMTKEIVDIIRPN